MLDYRAGAPQTATARPRARAARPRSTAMTATYVFHKMAWGGFSDCNSAWRRIPAGASAVTAKSSGAVELHLDKVQV